MLLSDMTDEDFDICEIPFPVFTDCALIFALSFSRKLENLDAQNYNCHSTRFFVDISHKRLHANCQ